MAEGGAWQSGVFDNGRDFHHGDKEASPIPGLPATMYNQPAALTGRGQDSARMTIISIALRSATALFSMVSFAVIASNEGYQDDYCIDNDSSDCYILSWNAILSSNMAYLLSIDVIVCFYSIVQLVLSIASSCKGKAVLKGPASPAATITFVLDQVLAYMLMAGCGAGMAYALTQDSAKILGCSHFRVFCGKNAASLVMSFFAFVCIALSSAMAYFRLYRMV